LSPVPWANACRAASTTQRASAAFHTGEQSAQLGAQRAEFPKVSGAQPGDQGIAFSRQADFDAPPILPRRPTLNPAAPFQAIHQPNRAVVSQMQAGREVADQQGSDPRRALEDEERLMLLGRNPGLPRRRLAETEKFPKGMPEGRQRFVVIPGEVTCGHTANGHDAVDEDNPIETYRGTI
jgi:hypothetical protein